ncbi:MAG: 2-deoxy-scyllo-inosamine dehydrogenase [Anaerolineales bacterium]|nr:alcohol dehydrogenase catalytic domain-containing protein [Anaerolineae bacterium]MBL8106230.1 alcohol dehydrogenase catalytic domain-containing protein [Anaerolineales bacterium]MBV6400237.1 2-deoxy-scyllo-inosamine dehydrogenase [Anaerolineales bacterium]MCC7188616.1 alcohol dehydrogenase catalytic domain-containing protein [Anaerolineales bacterium]
MKALWLENNKIDFREVSQPQKPNEALIKIRKAGICSTDLELVKGYYPYAGILGHEFVGEVAKADDASWVGQRVVGEINAVCGQCEQCLNGRPTHCESRTVLGIVNRDGVFAEYVCLPVANLHRVPASVPDGMAVFTEPLAAALEIQEQINIKPGDRVLLVGAGRLGQLIAQTLALTGCDLRVVARHKRQQELLTARGIRIITEEEIQRWRWDVVVEATGSPSGFALARQAIRPRGTLVLKSTYKGEMSVDFSSIVVDEINLIGSRCGPFEPALRLMESRQVDPTVLIDAEYSLTDAMKAFEHATRPGALKVVLNP